MRKHESRIIRQKCYFLRIFFLQAKSKNGTTMANPLSTLNGTCYMLSDYEIMELRFNYCPSQLGDQINRMGSEKCPRIPKAPSTTTPVPPTFCYFQLRNVTGPEGNIRREGRVLGANPLLRVENNCVSLVRHS